MIGNGSANSYLTAAREAEAELVIEKSRFICHVKPVSSKEEAEAFISDVRSEYKDATHNVPAYVIGRSGDVMWSSEDGEPQGTAGAPVLKMIVQEGLTGICIVTTRYFGGIKLGTGGLVRAYTSVAKLALEKAGLAEVKDRLAIRMSLDYKTFNRVNTMDLSGKADIRNVTYLDQVVFDLVTDEENEAEITALISDVSGGSARVLEKIITQDKILC